MESGSRVLDLRAAQLALCHFLPALEGRHVLIRSDNISVVYIIKEARDPGRVKASFATSTVMGLFPS